MENRKSVLVKLHEKGGVILDKIEAKHGDTISWEANDSDISIFVPDALEIFNRKKKVYDVTKGKSKRLKIMHKPNLGEQKKYYYAVYHKNLKDFAVGNSNPVIIVQG